MIAFKHIFYQYGNQIYFTKTKCGFITGILGYFLAGIMAVYALSGIVLIFRDTDFLKRNKQVRQKIEIGLDAEALGKALRMRDLKIESVNGDTVSFKQGNL